MHDVSKVPLLAQVVQCSCIAPYIPFQRTALSDWPPASWRPSRRAHPAAGAGAAPRPPKTKATAPAADDSALKQRVEQLEEQLVDMQVVIGTLELLARGGGGGTAPASERRRLQWRRRYVRLDGMESQLRALSAQIEQLTDQVVRSAAAPPFRRRRGAGRSPPPSTDTAASRSAAAPDAGRFGSTTITAGNGGDTIGGLIESDPPPRAAPRRRRARRPRRLARRGRPVPTWPHCRRPSARRGPRCSGRRQRQATLRDRLRLSDAARLQRRAGCL